MTFLIQALFLLLRVLEIAIIAEVILSWFAPRGQIMEVLDRYIGPFLYPFRMLNEKLLGRSRLPVDLSPLFALVAIEILRNLLYRLPY